MLAWEEEKDEDERRKGSLVCKQTRVKRAAISNRGIFFGLLEKEMEKGWDVSSRHLPPLLPSLRL